MTRSTILVPLLLLTCAVSPVFADPVGEARAALEREMQTLRAAGEPASVADLATTPAVPDHANGVLQLRRAYQSLNEAVADGEVTQRFFSDIDHLEGPYTPEQLQVLHNMVDENEETLALVRAAMEKGRFDWQIEMKSPLIGVLLRDLAEQRAVATILVGAAIVAQHNGNDDLALERVGHQLGIARALAQQPMFVSHLVVCGLGGLETASFTALIPNLDAAAGTPARKRAEALIAELLNESAFRESFHAALQTERVVQTDTAISIAEGRVRLDEFFAGVPVEHMPATPDRPDVAQQIAMEDAAVVMGYITEVKTAAEAPDWPSAKAKLPQRPSFEADRYYGRSTMPTYERGMEAHYVFLASRRLAAAALALRCYAIDHANALPKSLADLVPAYLPAVPSDPFAKSAPLRYAPASGVIYSIGPNGIDDGGEQEAPLSREMDLVMRVRG